MQRRQFLTRTLGLGAGTVLLAGCDGVGLSDESTQVQRLQPGQAILCVGDSLTAGYGAPSQESYPSVLARLGGIEVINAGVNGATSADASRRMPGLVSERPPGLVLLCIGGNDFLKQVPLVQTRTHLLSAIAAATAACPVVLIAEPKPSPFAAALGALDDHPLYAEVAEQGGALLYPNGWSAVLSNPTLRSDPIHANAAGYAHFATELHAWLTRQGFL